MLCFVVESVFWQMPSKKPKVTKKKLSDYTQNPKNHNLGTERGAKMLENSLNRYGAGRSVLADKDGMMIAGNQTLKAAMDAGIEDVLEIETDGKTLVVVKRTDLDLDNPDDTSAVELGYMDNRSHEVSFNLDTQQIAADVEAGVDMSLMYTPGELDLLVPELDDDDDIDVGGAKTISDQFICFVECASEQDLAALFQELQERGYKCRLLLS
jgi:hypothetical protein